MFKPILIWSVLAAYTVFGASFHRTNAQQRVDYPRLVAGQMPLYPAIARAAHITGTVELEITVEKGSVILVQTKSSSSPHLTNASITNVKTWKFESDSHGTFTVKYLYDIKGKQSALPENPRVELDLPRLVRVIARPFKLTCSDCP